MNLLTYIAIANGVLWTGVFAALMLGLVRSARLLDEKLTQMETREPGKKGR